MGFLWQNNKKSNAYSLGKTAKLTFHMVDDEDTVSLKANRAPFGKIIVSDHIEKNLHLDNHL